MLQVTDIMYPEYIFLHLMSLILYTLCPVQEPMIYLEDKGGMVRDYSISVIIDNSKSCFIDINENHSYLTIIIY